MSFWDSVTFRGSARVGQVVGALEGFAFGEKSGPKTDHLIAVLATQIFNHLV